MSEPAIRAIVVAVVVVVALGIAGFTRTRERHRAARSPVDLTGIEGRVVLFSDVACSRCDIVRAHLEGIGAPFTEVAFDADPDAVRRSGVTGVPLVVIRDAAGREVTRFAGVVPKARLAASIRAWRTDEG
jgi:predicted DsbA family dithiol-disulfide isomerase